MKKRAALMLLSVSLMCINSLIHAAETYGPIEGGDSMWRIAAKVRPADVSIPQAIMVLYHYNPDAFYRCNFNALNIGAVLDVPAPEVFKHLSTTKVAQQFSTQQLDWETFRRRGELDCPEPTDLRSVAAEFMAQTEPTEPETTEPAIPETSDIALEPAMTDAGMENETSPEASTMGVMNDSATEMRITEEVAESGVEASETATMQTDERLSDEAVSSESTAESIVTMVADNSVNEETAPAQTLPETTQLEDTVAQLTAETTEATEAVMSQAMPETPNDVETATDNLTANTEAAAATTTPTTEMAEIPATEVANNEEEVLVDTTEATQVPETPAETPAETQGADTAMSETETTGVSSETAPDPEMTDETRVVEETPPEMTTPPNVMGETTDVAMTPAETETATQVAEESYNATELPPALAKLAAAASVLNDTWADKNFRYMIWFILGAFILSFIIGFFMRRFG